MPRLRRLRDPRRSAELHARARHRAREHRVRLRASAAQPRFPYYMNTYGMHSIHGRAPAIATGPGDVAAGPVGLGRHRRRRRAVDRRQPPDPRAAPQRRPEDPAVQQPDLRADQGPVLPDVRARQDHQVHADGLAGLPVQPGVARARRRGDLRRPHARLRPQAPHSSAARRRRTTRAPRSSRSTRTATSSTTARSTRSRTPRPATTGRSAWSTASRCASARTGSKAVVRSGAGALTIDRSCWTSRWWNLALPSRNSPARRSCACWQNAPRRPPSC